MRPKLLLADDSVTIQRVIELTFADENVEVIAVGDGKGAIDSIQSSAPDIVLADVGMPERSGYEVAEFIKGDPRFAHIPVLLLTGAFEPVDDVRARAIGCEGVLVKPFEPQMVISRVRELLKGTREHAVDTSASSAIPAGPAAVKIEGAASPPEAAAAPPAPDTLEDYFDRLDAALANLGAPSGQKPPGPVAVPIGGHERLAPSTGGPSRSDAWLGDTSAAPAPASMPGSASLQSRPAAVPAGIMTDLPSAPAPPLHAAFAALLAAERGEPVEIPLPVQEPLSEEALEEIANRVVAKMGDEKMRALVLDAAERLVREEIDRIKSQA